MFSDIVFVFPKIQTPLLAQPIGIANDVALSPGLSFLLLTKNYYLAFELAFFRVANNK